MDNREQIETSGASGEATVKDNSPQTDAVKLVDMGEVTVETKGTIHGLEMNLTPRSF